MLEPSSPGVQSFLPKYIGKSFGKYLRGIQQVIGKYLKDFPTIIGDYLARIQQLIQLTRNQQEFVGVGKYLASIGKYLASIGKYLTSIGK